VSIHVAGQNVGVRLRDRLNSLDDRALGRRPTAEPLASVHRKLWGMVLFLLIAAVVTGLVGVAYLPGVLFAVAIGIAVAAVVMARCSRSL
jgi:hypothetical protein